MIIKARTYRPRGRSSPLHRPQSIRRASRAEGSSARSSRDAAIRPKDTILFGEQLHSTYFPTFTVTNPEQVILSRAAALTKRSFFYLLTYMSSGLEPEVGAAFQESPQSLKVI